MNDDAETLFERTPCGYLSTTAHGLITRVNQAFLEMTGFTRTELVGRRTFASLLTGGGRIYHETHYAPLLHMRGAATEIAFELVRADGRRLSVLVNSVLERDGGGRPAVVRSAVFGATQRREYEGELLRAKRRAEESEARAKALAYTLQQTLIPPTPPVVPGLDVAAAYRPAGDGREVGGDFYDVFEIGPGEWVVALGDVCGKGVDAAVVAALVRYTIRAASVRSPEPSAALRVVNDVLVRHETNRFCTLLIMRLQQREGHWSATVSGAGHPPPLLVRPGGAADPWEMPGSLAGVFEDAEFREASTVLGPGDTVVLYTDGVTEARRGSTFFGEERLCAAVAARAGSCSDVVAGLLADVVEFQYGVPRDDVAIVAVGLPPRSAAPVGF